MSASTKRKLRQAEREAGIDKKAQAAAEEAAKKAKEKRKWAIGTVIVAVVIALIIFINSGFLVKNSTALSIGDDEYSAPVVSYQMATQFYTFANQYGDYASVIGLDTSSGISGLSAQGCPLVNDGTWKDYFVTLAEQDMIQIKALCDYAEANGISLSDEEIANIDAGIAESEQYAELMGYTSLENFYALNYGQGVTAEIVRQENMRGVLANKVLTQMESELVYSDSELEEYYKSLGGESDYFDYSYYYVAEGEGAEDTANAILASYKEAKGDDIEAKLDAAVAANAEGAAVHQSNISASALGEYKEWLMEQTKSGAAAVVPGASNDFFVVVFESRNDNHYKMANIRHILVKAEASEDGTYSDEAKAAAKKEAEDILAQWKSGAATEESFAELANSLSEDGGSNTNGGLYEGVIKGQMVEEFDEFCFAGHKKGDTDIVYGESTTYAGYHVMYYVGEGELYSNAIARSALASTALNDFLMEQVNGLEATRGFGFRFVG